MPAKGKITVREMTLGERGAMPEGAIAILGEQTCDVWLNERAYWRNVPLRVWEYTLGGYQVIKKWLSYRRRNSWTDPSPSKKPGTSLRWRGALRQSSYSRQP